MHANFLKPTSLSFPSASRSKKLHNQSEIRAKRLGFKRESGHARSVYWVCGRRNKICMQGFKGFREIERDEEVNAFDVEEATVREPPSLSGDWLEATINDLSKWLVSGLFVTVILLRHDAEAVWAAMGAVFNALLSIQLKLILNQERPFPRSGADPGMPSSHAQTIFFAVGFITVTLVEWLGINALTTTVAGLAFITGCYFSWLRVSQQYHTVSQVIVGAILGFIFTVFWFWSWYAFVFNMFMSTSWVRIGIIVSAFGFCAGFMVHVWRKWIVEEI